MARLGLKSVAARISGALLRLHRKSTNSSSAASKVLTALEYRPFRTCRVCWPAATGTSIASCHLIDPALFPSTTTSNVPRRIPAGFKGDCWVTFSVASMSVFPSGDEALAVEQPDHHEAGGAVDRQQGTAQRGDQGGGRGDHLERHQR